MLYVTLGLTALLVVLLAALWLASNTLIARRRPDEPASPADYDLGYEDISFTTGDGLTLGGWYIPAPKPPSHGAGAMCTVVVCSGHNGSMDSDAGAAPWLHAAGFDVLMFDWRGRGRSQGRYASMGTLERLDLLAAVDFARSRGAGRVGVLGFSMGGAVALSTAASCPGIDAVCSDGGYARIDSAVTCGLRERGVSEPLATIVGSAIVTVAGLRLGVDLRQANPLRWAGGIAPRPVLFIHGERDPLVPIAEVEAMLARCGEPKELWRVREAGHRDIHERQPEEYRRRVIDFFSRALGA